MLWPSTLHAVRAIRTTGSPRPRILALGAVDTKRLLSRFNPARGRVSRTNRPRRVVSRETGSRRQDTVGVLVVLQALDAAGKDGTIRHVMSGVNPQGVAVHSFKVPSSEEVSHDFLWRYQRQLPERGGIGV